MTINVSGLESSSNILGLIEYINVNSSGMFIALVLLAVFFILFMNLRKNGTLDALLASAFPCFILSLLFKAVGLINLLFVIMFMIILAVGVIFKFLEE